MNKGLKGLLRWQYLIPIFLASFTSVSALALAAVTAPSSVFAFQAAQLRRVPTSGIRAVRLPEETCSAE